ncbi:MAG: SDR family NAD(P)-dependent oxidoreductase [Solirubrobacteraceae bacterium]
MTRSSLAAQGRCGRGCRLRELAEQINSGGGTALPIATDLTDIASVSAAAAQIAEALGTLNVLVNNAGVMLPGEITSQPLSEWERMIDTNLSSALHAIRALLPALIDAARNDGVADLINMSSIGGKLVFPRYAVYGATKAALTHLSAMLRAELSPLRVRVTDVQPGLTESELEQQRDRCRLPRGARADVQRHPSAQGGRHRRSRRLPDQPSAARQHLNCRHRPDQASMMEMSSERLGARPEDVGSRPRGERRRADPASLRRDRRRLRPSSITVRRACGSAVRWLG